MSSSSARLAVIGYRYLYEVTDPLRPRLQCTASNTPIQLASTSAISYLRAGSPGHTDLVRRDLGSGQEQVLASIPEQLDLQALLGGGASWTRDGSVIAYRQGRPPAQGDDCCGWLDFFVYHAGAVTKFYTFHVGIVGIGGPIRFSPWLGSSVSEDGRYTESGGTFGKGADLGRVFRVGDGAQLYAFTTIIGDAVWIPGGDRLLFVTDVPRVWDPSGSVTQLSQLGWIRPSLSPDGRYAAYSGFDQLGGPQAAPIHIAIHDLQKNPTVAAPTQPRSQPGFVRDGWLWYLEEASCSGDPQCPWPTRPTGRILAYNLATGSEQAVQFLAGESPVTAQDYFGFQITGVAPGA